MFLSLQFKKVVTLGRIGEPEGTREGEEGRGGEGKGERGRGKMRGTGKGGEGKRGEGREGRVSRWKRTQRR